MLYYGKPQYHYELCNYTASTTIGVAATTSMDFSATTTTGSTTSVDSTTTSSAIATTTTDSTTSASITSTTASITTTTIGSVSSTTGVHYVKRKFSFSTSLYLVLIHFSTVVNPANCLMARLDLVFRLQAQNSKLIIDPFIANAAALNKSLCLNDPDPIYMIDDRCQCDAAKAFFVASYPSGILFLSLSASFCTLTLCYKATMDTAWSIYSTLVESGNTTTPNWHCEACPNTVVKRNCMYSSDT